MSASEVSRVLQLLDQPMRECPGRPRPKPVAWQEQFKARPSVKLTEPFDGRLRYDAASERI
jgi:hypothetical protein